MARPDVFERKMIDVLDPELKKRLCQYKTLEAFKFALLQPTKANHRRRNKSIMAWAAEL